MATAVSTFSLLHHRGEGRNVLQRPSNLFMECSDTRANQRLANDRHSSLPFSDSIAFVFRNDSRRVDWAEEPSRWSVLSSQKHPCPQWREQKASVVWRPSTETLWAGTPIWRRWRPFLLRFSSEAHLILVVSMEKLLPLLRSKGQPHCNDVASAKELVAFLYCLLRSRDYDPYIL